MITYIIHSSVIWVSLLGLYYLVFRRYTFFKINRLYLIGSLFAGLIIPLTDIPGYFLFADVFSYTIEPIVIAGTGNGLKNEVSALQNTDQWIGFSLLLGWSLITIAAIGRFFIATIKIYRLVTLNETQKRDGYTQVNLEGDVAPFSFFKYIFIPKKHMQSPEYAVMLAHEKVHVRQKHTLDILLAEAVKIFFWFNPLLYLFKKTMAENHEFIADEVAAGTTRKTYSHLLIQIAELQPYRLPVNSFIQSPIQNRIKMMYKNRSKPFFMAIYLLVLPLVFALALLGFDAQAADMVKLPVNNVTIEQQDTLPVPPPPPPPSPVPPPPPPPSPPSPPQNEPITVNGDPIFKVVEQMPRFPGCENESGTNKEKEECAKLKLLEYVYQNIKYPPEARKKGVQGTVVIQFIVATDGKIDNVNIIREIGEGCGEAAAKVIRDMNLLPERWTPGKQRGKAVKVMYTFPVKFLLEEGPKQQN